jgi:hypothetical protein
MHSKIACDHNDHDHYADDVKDIHCFTPIEIPSVFNDLGGYSTIARDCDRGLSKSAHRGRDQARWDELAISLPRLYAELCIHRLCGGSDKLRWGGRPFERVRDDMLGLGILQV